MTAAAMYPRSLVIVEPGAQADADRELLRTGGHRLSGQFRARTGGRRRRAGRLHQDRRDGGAALRVSTLWRHGRGAAQLTTISPSPSAAPWCATRLSCALAARAAKARSRRQPAARPQHVDNTLLIEHAAGALRKPRAVQVGARRRKPRRVPGQDRRRAARAEDRRQDDDARAAAVGRGRSRQQAGAGNLRRRRGLRPRRHRRRARSRLEVLSDVARHSGEGSRSAADPGLHRRDHRGDRA